VPRPKEFDPVTAVADARAVFWSQGYAATTTEDLRNAMGIGRQSFYDSFGGKREVFLLALEGYAEARFEDATRVIGEAPSPRAGLERYLATLAEESDAERARGCFGVSSVSELGTSDPEVQRITGVAGAKNLQLLAATVRRAQKLGEIDATLDPERTARLLGTAYVGMRVLGKGGATAEQLRDVAASLLESLTR
jgi:TetR/AcrR family transcriptional repressor of nem operon